MIRLGRRREAETSVDLRVLHQAAALVLGYPDDELLGRLPLIRDAVAGTPWAGAFEPVLRHLEQGSPLELRAFHVQEFDLSRRHAMHLTYWTEGDTRRRGETLTAFKQVYRDSGLLVDVDGELPDHLPMVLEFAAADPGRGCPLLAQYRPSLELLRLALEDDKLPHAGVLQAICAALPGPSPQSRAEVQAMVKSVQPVETVGLDGYGAGGFVSVPELVSSIPGERN